MPGINYPLREQQPTLPPAAITVAEDSTGCKGDCGFGSPMVHPDVSPTGENFITTLNDDMEVTQRKNQTVYRDTLFLSIQRETGIGARSTALRSAHSVRATQVMPITRGTYCSSRRSREDGNGNKKMSTLSRYTRIVLTDMQSLSWKFLTSPVRPGPAGLGHNFAYTKRGRRKVGER